jgi:hypothetical protein
VFIRITICESFVHRRKLLLGKRNELFGVGAPGRQQGGDHAPAFGGSPHKTMRPRHFANQAMRPQQGQLPPARRQIRGRAVEVSPKVPVAKAIDEVLAPVDGRQQRRVGCGQRIEGAIAPTVLANAPALRKVWVPPSGGPRERGTPNRMSHYPCVQWILPCHKVVQLLDIFLKSGRFIAAAGGLMLEIH